MGLGFFIAKILLEQTGGMVKADQSAGRRRARFRRLGPGRDRRVGAARGRKIEAD